MDGIRHRERFAEIEALMDNYFRCHIAPVMSKTRTFLTEKQGEEMVEYSTSPGGILSLMASSMQPLADPYQVLKATGEWNSKTTEDYIEMCKAEIAGSEAMQQDLAYMAERWREAVVQEVGRERYDELSRELGCDLAYAFVDYRVEQLMIGRLVEERMPKSSSEYIVRKAAESSLLGLTQTLSRSPLAEEIERRGEAAYRPSKIEKGAAKVLGVSADAVMLGGAGSWTALARFVGMDAAVSAVASRLWPEGPEPLSAELCISKGVFDSDDNVFEGFRREAAAIPAAENALVSEANGRLRNKIPVVSYDLAGWWKPGAEYLPWPDTRSAEERERADRYRDVPLVVAPGQEEAYLQDKARREAAEDGEQHRKTGGKEEVRKEGTGEKEGKEEEKDDALQEGTALSGEQTREERGGEEAVPAQGNANGWEGVLGTLGLDGMGDVAGNLGYVIAMLPDMLPIASIVAGMFIRNPLLKMLLIGLGGANLLNKAGHEALEKRRTEGNRNTATTDREVKYKRYADEPLDPRIASPVLQGSTLVATIDGIPCTVQLSPTVADAYRTGALPLNTLANAVLAQSDRLRAAAAQNYDNGQQETLVRTRGIQ